MPDTATADSLPPGAARRAPFAHRGGTPQRRAAPTGPGPSLLAAALAAAAWALGVKGTDHAAQTYWVTEVHRHGLALFDTGWYGGTYPLSYTVTFPLLGAALGLGGAALASSVVATWSFDRLSIIHLGHRTAGSWYFALCTLLQVAIGQLPFLAGEAFGLTALVALSRHHRVAAVALGLATALCSPLAAAFLALACVAWAWRGQVGRRGPLGLAAVGVAVVGAVTVAFPGTGYFPFPVGALVIVEGLCLGALSPLVRATPAVRAAVVLYALAALAAFVVPNPLGGNAVRLATAVGIPVLVCMLTAPSGVRWPPGVTQGLRRGGALLPAGRWPRYGAVALVPFVVWQWSPGVDAVASSATDPSTTAAYYQPLLAALASPADRLARIEVVPTREHWEAAFMAPSIPIARGWERQIDTARNGLFYRPGLLSPLAYHRWLVAEGIRWVALSGAPTDYSGVAEAAVLRTGAVPGLRRVWRSPTWTLWQVVDSPGLLSGPGRLTDLGAGHLSVAAVAAGDITVRVRSTRYWSVTAGAACVGSDPAGWTRIHATGPGVVEVRAALIPASRCPS